MPYLSRSFRSFSFIFSSKKYPNTDLPDYYRSTRREDYGPNLRHLSQSGHSTDVLDICRKESYEYSCSFLLPDIFDDELEISPQTEEISSFGGSNKINKSSSKYKTILSAAQTPFQTLKRSLPKRKVHVVTRAEDGFELDLSN